MENNIIYITDAPRSRVKQIKDSLDLDLYPRLLANHPEHIKRAKAKRDRVEAERKEKANEMARKTKENETLMTLLGGMSASLVMVLAVLIALW